MEYEDMKLPFALPSFADMNKKQAEQYFKWFMEIKAQRIEKLQKYISSDTDDVSLDRTPESLIRLWKWFQDKIELEKKMKRKYKKK